MDISNVSYLLHDFEAIREFQNTNKTQFIGKSRRKVSTFAEYFVTYASHRMLVRRHENDELIGYAEFAHFPEIPALPRECWTDWLKYHYCYNIVNDGNVLFMNYYLFNPVHNPQLFLNILREIFHREYKKRFILIVESPKQQYSEDARVEYYPNYDFLSGLSHVIYPRIFNLAQCKNTQKIHIMHRDVLVDKMLYRLALAEDNDDIVAVLDTERSDLRKEYGDFYIAETMMEQEQKKENSCVFIVAEIDNKTMGFIWLNKNLDIWKLVYNYELEIFGNLVKLSPHARSSQQIISTTAIRQKQKGKLFTDNAIEDCLNYYDGIFDISSNKSMYSKSKLMVASTYGIINVTESNERLYLIEEFLGTMKNLKDTLRNPTYYTIEYAKDFSFCYNILEDGKANGDEEGNPPEPELNAFCLQLFAIAAPYDIRRLFRFIATAFSAYPDRDYLLLSMPRSTKITPSLSELLKQFVAVVPRPKCKITDYLFITHRSNIYGEITVATVREQDVNAIETILTMGDSVQRRITRYSIGHAMKQDFGSELELTREIIDEVLANQFSEYKVLTIRCGDSSKPIDDNVIVGFVILRQFYDLHLLSDHFLIPKTHPYYNFVRSEVVILKLQPLYHAQSDMVFREIGRHIDVYDFYYFAPNVFSHRRLTNDLVSKMQPIEPQHIKKIYKYVKSSDDSFNTDIHLNDLNLMSDTFSAFNMNLKPTRFFGNKDPIIILGFSKECRAFLRRLIFDWNNLDYKTSHCCVPQIKVVVIVRPGEVEAEYDKDLLCSMCEDQRDCWIHYQNFSEYLRDTVERMDIRVWVNFVNSKVDRINRQENLIILENKCEYYYDTLLIFTAVHFGLPTLPTEAELPHNFAQINSRFDKLLMYHRIRYIREQSVPTKIVVYGSHIRTFEFINFLLKHGIDAQSITLVIPFGIAERDLHLTYNIPYADLNIEFILEQMVEDLGVKHYDRMNFISWTTSTDDSISEVMFESFPDKNILLLDCDLFINYFEHNKLDTDTLNLLKAAEIELFERLVLVDECFRTNDRNIFALGNIIQRRDEPNFQYKYTNAIDGADKVIQILGLNVQPNKDIGARYRKPTYLQAQLPMGYCFVKISLPKPYLANHLSNEYSTNLVTYKDFTFCRVRLNDHSIVEEFVCVTQQRIPFDFLIYFVGKHETLLNDLQARWYLKEIDSFLDFFQEPWTELIMHRNFHVLRAAIKDLCMEAAQDVTAENSDKDRTSRKKIMKRYMDDTGTTKEVEKTVLTYLRRYRTEFSPDLYALPEDFTGK